MRRLLAIALLSTISVRGAAQIPPSIEFGVPKAPTIASNSRPFLAYELHITNFTPSVMVLKGVEVVRADDTTRSLLTVSDTVLMRIVARPGSTVLPSERLNVAGGSRAMLYLWVPVDKANPPATIRHRLTVQPMRQDSITKQLTADSLPQVLGGAVVQVGREAVSIGPPLRGEWLAANGPSNVSGHRRTVLALRGRLTIPQRFAIDFIQVDSMGNTFRRDRSKNENFIAHGREVLAVANGVVVATKDSIPENTGGPASRAVPITLETIGGNHLVIEIGPSRYAFYAHLQPGSLRVRVGDRVKRGDVIGLVGNSGNSTEPHLHFHLTDDLAAGTSTLGAEGIPYSMSFELLGPCMTGLSMRCMRITPVRLDNAIPLQNQLVRFPE